jgi:hypothetical protein
VCVHADASRCAASFLRTRTCSQVCTVVLLFCCCCLRFVVLIQDKFGHDAMYYADDSNCMRGVDLIADARHVHNSHSSQKADHGFALLLPSIHLLMVSLLSCGPCSLRMHILSPVVSRLEHDPIVVCPDGCGEKFPVSYCSESAERIHVLHQRPACLLCS